ncbi:hypothetical protein PIB30_024047 [Stylosanthes scabra]|uniref:Uncharacterized protein n=1 Tax=Stylosanthes scabra TaxID=79078 RepID=A0ABU6R9V9_9FABA|nr:hypothetical protein [Stylosanthes scabra]
MYSFQAFFRLQRSDEGKIYESWRQRAAKRLRELFHEIQKKGTPHSWIPKDIFARLVEFWRSENFKKLQHTNKKNWAFETSGSLNIGRSTTYPATRERMAIELG